MMIYPELLRAAAAVFLQEGQEIGSVFEVRSPDLPALL
jgi:hypothetical protein